MKALGKLARKKKKETPKQSNIPDELKLPEDEHKFNKTVSQSKKAALKQKELVRPPSSKKYTSDDALFFSISDDSQDEDSEVFDVHTR